MILGIESVDEETARSTLHLLLKYRSDIEAASKGRPPRLLRPPALEPGPRTVVLDVLTGFVGEPRRSGLPVSVTEAADAADAIRHLPLEDRQAIKYALGATLVKSSAHWRAFDTAFEVYFSMRGPQYSVTEDDALAGAEGEDGAGTGQGQGRGEGQSGAGGLEMVSPEEIAAMLYKALRDGDLGMLGAVARLAVGRYAGMEPGRPVGGTYYLYRTLRNLDLEGVLALADRRSPRVGRGRDGGGGGRRGAGSGPDLAWPGARSPDAS